MKVVGAILFVAVLVWDIMTDYSKWQAGITVDHLWEAFVRAGLLVPSVLLLSGFTFKKVPYRWAWKVCSTALLLGSVWWLAFDGVYNALRGFSWWFNGSVDGGDSVLDLFLMKLQDWQEAVLKIGLVVVGGFIYFKSIMHEKD